MFPSLSSASQVSTPSDKWHANALAAALKPCQDGAALPSFHCRMSSPSLEEAKSHITVAFMNAFFYHRILCAYPRGPPSNTKVCLLSTLYALRADYSTEYIPSSLSTRAQVALRHLMSTPTLPSDKIGFIYALQVSGKRVYLCIITL